MKVDLTRISAIHLALLAIVAVLCLATGWGDPASLLLGGLVMVVDLWLLRWMTSFLISGGDEKSGPPAFAIGAMILHMGIFVGLAVAIFSRLPVDAMAFAAGVTSLLAACVIEAVRVGRINAIVDQRI